MMPHATAPAQGTPLGTSTSPGTYPEIRHGYPSSVPETPAQPVRIRFCVNNPRTLAERNDLIARGYACLGCLGNCTRCFQTRYLEINGRFIEGDTYDRITRRADGPGQQPGTDPCGPAADDRPSDP